MTYKIKDIIEQEKNKNFSKEKIEEFFKTGLELGVFKVSGNEGSELIYENVTEQTEKGETVLLNEVEKDEPKPIQQAESGIKPAPVGNKVTTGWSNPFGGTSWGS